MTPLEKKQCRAVQVHVIFYLGFHTFLCKKMTCTFCTARYADEFSKTKPNKHKKPKPKRVDKFSAEWIREKAQHIDMMQLQVRDLSAQST